MGLPPLPLWTDSIPSFLILEEIGTLFESYYYKFKKNQQSYKIANDVQGGFFGTVIQQF